MRMTVHGTGGPVAVKLAGLAGGIRLYDEEIAAAVAAGFRVVALDISGDRRDDPPKRPIDWDLYADEVEEAIDHASADRAVIWGTSFGCSIALAAARRHPDRISGLLLSHPPDPLWRPRLHLALLDWAEHRADPDLAGRVMFSTAFLGLTSWEGIAPALWVRLPALIRASLEAATPPATVKRKLELLFRDEPGLPPSSAADSRRDDRGCVGSRRAACRRAPPRSAHPRRYGPRDGLFGPRRGLHPPPRLPGHYDCRAKALGLIGYRCWSEICRLSLEAAYGSEPAVSVGGRAIVRVRRAVPSTLVERPRREITGRFRTHIVTRSI